MKERLISLFNLGLRSIGASSIIFFCLLCLIVNFTSKESSRPDILHRILYFTINAENWFYELRNSHLYDHNIKAPDVLLVSIDDASLNAVGRWPWSRAKHAELLTKLAQLGAKVVAFDVLFPEPEGEGPDGAFREAIRAFQKEPHHQVIIGYGLVDSMKENVNLPMEMYLNVLKKTKDAIASQGRMELDPYSFVAPRLLNAEPGLGFLTALPDIDGVYRHAPVIAPVGGDFFPSLGLAAFLAFIKKSDTDGVRVEKRDALDFALRVSRGEKERIHLVNALNGEVKVRYYGSQKDFVTIPAKEIFSVADPARSPLKEVIAGRAIFIGSTALGANDLRHAPVDPGMPGVFSHMNIFNMFNNNYFYRPEDESLLVTLGIFLVGVALILIASARKSPFFEVSAFLLVALGAFFLDRHILSPKGYLVRLFFCEICFFSLYAWFTVLGVFEQAREKKKIRDTFARYVSPEVVREMLANPGRLRLGGEKKELTMLFSDVRDFTKISEDLPPQELSTLLNIYMGKMTSVLFSTQGTLDKYVGDAMVAFWGAPVDVPEQAYQGVRAACLMLEALPRINQDFERRGYPKINIGIGINTGEVSVGNMGSDQIFSYTALGDNMNLASRLEALTKHYGANLMISEFTERKLGERRKEFQIRPLDRVRVKGKTKTVLIFEVLPNWHPFYGKEQFLEAYHRAFEAYQNGAFAQCLQYLQGLPNDPSCERLSRFAREFDGNPPKNWDGVITHESKH